VVRRRGLVPVAGQDAADAGPDHLHEGVLREARAAGGHRGPRRRLASARCAGRTGGWAADQRRRSGGPAKAPGGWAVRRNPRILARQAVYPSMLSGRIWKAGHVERLDPRGGQILPESRARLARRRVGLTTWRPAAYRSPRPLLVQSSLALPGPNPHVDGRIRTALALSGSRGWPRGALSSVPPHLPQTSRGMAVALDISPAAAPAHAPPARRRSTTGSQRHAKCGSGRTCPQSPRPDILCPRRPPPEQEPE
jgi:hypothetical protein